MLLIIPHESTVASVTFFRESIIVWHNLQNSVKLCRWRKWIIAYEQNSTSAFCVYLQLLPSTCEGQRVAGITLRLNVSYPAVALRRPELHVESLEKAINTLPVPDSSLYNWDTDNASYYLNVFNKMMKAKGVLWCMSLPFILFLWHNTLIYDDDAGPNGLQFFILSAIMHR